MIDDPSVTDLVARATNGDQQAWAPSSTGTPR